MSTGGAKRQFRAMSKRVSTNDCPTTHGDIAMPHSFMTFGGIAFLFVAVGITAHMLDTGIDNPGPIVILAILAFVFLKVARTYNTAQPGMLDGASARFDRVEQRLSDVQDIVISVDERLARLEVALK
jgi:hypothetical protein